MEPAAPATSSATELHAVRTRRAELRAALNLLELALAAPASGRAVVWGETVHEALGNIANDLTAHIEVTEGPGGLHQSILAGDIRLANAVEALTAEHSEIAAELAVLMADSEAPVTAEDVEQLRDRATRMLGQVSRHRQRGADLIYEAYQTDIGGGD